MPKPTDKSDGPLTTSTSGAEPTGKPDDLLTTSMSPADTMDRANEPLTTSKRAAEIALLEGESFGLAEFTELTCVGIPGLGVYRVSAAGVSIDSMQHLGDYAPPVQLQIHQAARLLSLAFPCTVAQFVTWYEATKGTNGASDFSLADGFLRELKKYDAPSPDTVGASVPSTAVVAAFKVRPDERANANWWNRQMRNCKRSKLAEARAARGTAQRASRWFPVLVAGWLIDKDHLSLELARSAMRQHFPDHPVDHL